MMADNRVDIKMDEISVGVSDDLARRMVNLMITCFSMDCDVFQMTLYVMLPG